MRKNRTAESWIEEISDWEKPDGLFVIRPEDVGSFVQALPVEKLFGVGQVTASKLHALGVKTCGDMQALGPDVLIDRFGKQGYRLHEMAHGRDERAVVGVDSVVDARV